MTVELKTPEQFRSMRKAGLVVAEILDLLRDAVRPGVTLLQLDALAEAELARRGAASNFKGYHGFPAVLCASPNEVVVHGIPTDRVLDEGDIVSLDFGASVDGWHADAARTVPVGEVAPEVRRLLEVTEEAMWRGIAAIRDGGRIGDVGAAVERYVKGQGRYGIVEDYVGHGIGSEMHMEPDVPNVGKAGKGERVQAGMALAIEPMITLGSKKTGVLEDDWTVVTWDDSWAAHFENTVAVTPEGLVVTTALDGGAADLARLGVPVAAL